MNNQRGSANIILIAVIVILVLLVGYFVLVKKSEPTVQQTVTPTSTAPTGQVSQTSGSNTASNNSGVSLDLSSPQSQQYKTVLTEAFAKPANFNEHYVVATIGCGTGCYNYAVIDKTNGKVYFAPVANDVGSSVENGGQQYTPYGLHSTNIKIIVENGSKMNTYAFNGTSFTLVSSVKTSGTSSVNFMVSPATGPSPLMVRFSFSRPSDWPEVGTYSGSAYQTKLYYGDGGSDFVIPGDCHACGGGHTYASPGTYATKLTKFNNYPNDPEESIGTATVIVK